MRINRTQSEVIRLDEDMIDLRPRDQNVTRPIDTSWNRSRDQDQLLWDRDRGQQSGDHAGCLVLIVLTFTTIFLIPLFQWLNNKAQQKLQVQRSRLDTQKYFFSQRVCCQHELWHHKLRQSCHSTKWLSTIGDKGIKDSLASSSTSTDTIPGDCGVDPTLLDRVIDNRNQWQRVNTMM